MKKLFIYLMSLIIFLVPQIGNTTVLKIDKNLTLESSILKNSFNSVNQLNSFVLDENIDDKNKISVLITKAKSTTIANKPAMERIWKENKTTAKIIENDGCKKIKSNHYECSRLVSLKDKYQAQRLIWLGKNDMAYVIVDHVNSAEKAKLYSESFKVQAKVKKAK